MRALPLMALLLAGCLEESGGAWGTRAPQRAVSDTFTPPAGLTRLRFSSTPHLDPEGLKNALSPLAEYLSRGLSVPVEVSVASSYDELGELMARGEVDLAQFSPFSFVRAARSTRLQPIATVIADGSASAAGYIVVRADSPYRQLEDLQGKRFAYVDPASTSGYLYPVKLMKDRGLDPLTFFSHTEFLVHHDAAVLSVLEGRFDGTATYQGALQRQKGIDPLALRIIAKTPRTPRDIYCAREGLPKEVVERISELLLAFSVRTPEGRTALRPLNVNGFIPADVRAYEPVREVAEALFDGGLR